MYDVINKVSSPKITIRLPTKILKDLVMRAEEQGHTIELEFALRLARSLERDNEMLKQDEEWCFKAFQKQQKLS